MADNSKVLGFETHIYSIDQHKPKYKADDVTFLKGDCFQISKAMTSQMLKALPHSWLIIEDAHVNVLKVTQYFSKFMKQGDYLIVEDSGSKPDDLGLFIHQNPNKFLVETKYLDFFGYNSTCSPDSIFKRVELN